MNFYITMIYVLDTGYSGKHLDVIGEPDTVGHGTAMANIIKQYSPKSRIVIAKIDEQMRQCELVKMLISMKTRLRPNDILLITWVVDRNPEIDFLVSEIARTNAVVCAAGNFSSSIEGYSPAGADGVIAVSCINKSGNLAKMSNYGTDVVMYGTSVTVDSIQGQMVLAGTSASASIYASLMDRAPVKLREKFIRRAFNMLTRKFRSELGI